MCQLEQDYPLAPTPSPLLKPPAPVKLEEWLPCGTNNMSEGLPLREFQRLRAPGEENAQRTSPPCGHLLRRTRRPRCPFCFLWVRAGFLSLSAMDTRGWIILCCGGLFYASSFASAYASSTPLPVVRSKNVSRHCPGNVSVGQNPPPWRSTRLEGGGRHEFLWRSEEVTGAYAAG